MVKVARLGTSAFLAAAVTAGLFFLMQLLIATGSKKLDDDAVGRNIEMVKVEREQQVQRKERVERPPEQVKPPELDVPELNTAAPTQTVFNFDLPRGEQTVQGTGIATGDGEYLPIVKVNPIYPRRAAEQGVEGYVIVQYTVTREGTTRNVEVIEADPRGYFERAAIKAAEKYKYKPRVINGEPVEVPGVRTKITFQLAGEG